MKKLLLAAFIFIGAMSIQKASAQINVSINIGSQPAWAPVGYNHVDYYYLPDINCYYDVANAQYVYLRGRRWYHARTLPARYRNYNIYNSYKVVVNRRTPYRTNRVDIRDYSKYKGHHSQPMIRDSKDAKYYQNNGHGHAYGHDKGKEHGKGNGHDNGRR
ncbi:MAG TPA: hypothetical protein VFQ86_03150 [Arachidicoccus soli]|nr:hypothetical protein [Arachidicoccus soli]